MVVDSNNQYDYGDWMRITKHILESRQKEGVYTIVDDSIKFLLHELSESQNEIFRLKTMLGIESTE